MNVDLLDEARDEVVNRMASYQQKIAQHYNQSVQERKFRVEDLVLREAEISTPQ